MATKSIFRVESPDRSEAFKVEDIDGVASIYVDGVKVTATVAEINRIADASARVVDLDATSLAVTAALHGDRMIKLSHTGAASTATLPAATGSGIKYTFIVAAVNTNGHIITALAGDIMEGKAYVSQDAADTVLGFESGASDIKLTLNGTTTGGAAIGDKVEVIDYATDKWCVVCHLSGSGIEATPFST